LSRQIEAKEIKLKKLITILTTLSLIALTIVPAVADTEVDISGQVRVRSEIDGKSFDAANTTGIYELMRTRINIEANADENASAFIQFQDSRVLGGADQFDAWQSGSLNDGKNVDIHQAYVQIDRLWFDGFGTKAGRFEFNMGGQRVFGSVGWHNVARSWEGGLFWYKAETFKITSFCFKAQEEMETLDTLGNRDFDVFGGLIELDKINLELFGIYERDNDTLLNGTEDTVLAGCQLGRMTFGFYYKNKHNQLDFEFNGAYQAGSQMDTIDIAAMMFTGEVGYSFEGDKKARMAVGVDYASGDDDLTDTDYKAYNNLYYTGHKFRGHMDYFLSSGSTGLMDIMLRGKFNPHPKWTVKGDFHYFKTAAEYTDVTTTSSTLTSDMGMEFDFAVNTSSVAGVKLEGGVSIFLPKESLVRRMTNDPASTDTDPTVWAWGQTVFNF